MKDDLGSRQKNQYELRTRFLLPRRTYVLIRIDGKTFHTYTKDCERPYDLQLMSDMGATAKYLCENITGAKLAYVQSDEISLLLTDFDSIDTQSWFDGNVQKIVSISASLATGYFNRLRPDGEIAFFDSRCWTISDPTEVSNYFIWRQQDACRNAVSMAAQSLFSHLELQGKTSAEMQEKMFQEKGINFNDYPVRFKRGTCITIEELTKPVYFTSQTPPYNKIPTNKSVLRKIWAITEPPIFTKDPTWLSDKIPKL